MDFELHPQLKKDLQSLGDFSLSHVMLYPSSVNPWLVLVPRSPDTREWHQLSSEEQSELCREISKVSLWMEREFEPDKINVGALGNMVPQLHVHIIGRYKDDVAWPGAIWGKDVTCEPQGLEKIQSLSISLF